MRRNSWAALWISALAAPAAIAQEPAKIDYQSLEAAYRAVADDRDEVADLVERFVAGAEQHAGTEAAVPFLTWIVLHGVPDVRAVDNALATISEEHTKSPDVGPVVERVPHLASLLGRESAMRTLGRFAEGAAHPEIQARVLFERGRMVLGQPADAVSADQRDQALEDIAQAKKLTKDKTLRAEMRAFDTTERGFGTGDVAPEIAGLDINGVPFRLSDYRGKVVVLDFWGDW